MTTKSNNTFADFQHTCSLSGGQYSAVKAYRSSRDSVADYLVRPGVSRGHRLQNSIEWAQRLNAVEVAAAVNAKYGTDDITAADAARYITAQIKSWETSLLKPQRQNPFLTIAETKNGAPVLQVHGTGIEGLGAVMDFTSLFFVGHREGYTLIEAGEAKKPPVSNSARVKDFVRRGSESGKYMTLKLNVIEPNFEAVCIGGKVYTPAELRAVAAWSTVAV